MKANLVAGEEYWREMDYKRCFQTYLKVAQQFEALNDYETASYFHKRCLDISIEFSYADGEALAYKGLGIAEEKVMNKHKAMEHLETSLNKANELNLQAIQKQIARDLVRVYQ